jgi:hypothetical protein
MPAYAQPGFEDNAIAQVQAQVRRRELDRLELAVPRPSSLKRVA